MNEPAKPFSKRCLTFLIGLFAPLIFAAVCHADFYRFEMFDARSLAMGGAMRSLPDTVAGVRFNPASIAPDRGFFANINYATRSKSQYDGVQATLVDNSSSPLAGALQYQRFSSRSEDREDVSLTIAGGSKTIAWGGTGRHVSGREDQGEWDSTIVADAGVLLMRPNGLNFAVVGHDLFATTLDTLDQRIAFGASYRFGGAWTVSGDFVRHFEEDFEDGQDGHLGLEWSPDGSPWALRLGQMWDGETGKDAFSAGIGFTRGSVRLGYGAQKIRQDAGMFAHAFTVSGRF